MEVIRNGVLSVLTPEEEELAKQIELEPQEELVKSPEQRITELEEAMNALLDGRTEAVK